MGGGIFKPAQKTKKSKTNQAQSYQESNNVDILQPDFLNEIIKECVEHALIDDNQIRMMIKQKYEFYLQCIRLPKMDYISKTDPAIYCYLMKDNEPEFIHKTEVIPDDQDPLFAKPLQISFDLTQFNKDIIFNIYDIDKYNHFGEHERQYIGTVQASISSILMEDTFQCAIRYDEKQSGENKRDIQSIKRNTKSNQSQQRGEFKIRQYNCDQYSDFYIFQVEGWNIKSKESVYLRIVTLNKNCQQNNETEKGNEVRLDEPREIPLFQTDLMRIQKVMNWHRFEIQEKKIYKYLKFELYQFFESRVKKELIGEFKVQKEDLKTLHATEQPICMLNKKTVQGILRFQKVTKMMHPHTLLQYIYGGLNVQFLMAFDYSQISTNIYVSEQENTANYQNLINQYESAISNCVDLIRYYQTNQMVPMYGMGARLPPSFTHHSNCFALSGDWYDPEIDLRNKENAINIFKNTFKRIKPSSSLIFSDMLKFANEYCQEECFNTDKQTLCILLLFSHNELPQTDIDETIAQLTKFVQVPFQVINIGIGNSSFQYITTLLSEENYESSKKFSFIHYDNYKSDQFGFCQEILKTVPKSLLDKARSQRVPPLKSFDNMLVAREFYQSTLRIGEKKTFSCINERPFFDYLTQELGYKVDIIKDIFINGLEQEDLGLVLDRIGTYSKPSYSQPNSRFYSAKPHEDAFPSTMLKKAKEFYRLKEKYNAHTKKQESKTLAIKKQNADNLSPFSFFYKSDQKNEKQQQQQQETQNNNSSQYRFRLLPDYPESYQYSRIQSANNLINSDQELNPTNKGPASVYNGYKSDEIENNFSFNNSPLKLQNSGFLDSNQKKPLRQNNFMSKWKDALVQSAQINNSPLRNDKKQRPVLQGINCTFCPGDQINIILMPCGHNCCCQEYLDQFDSQICPICHINVKFYDEASDYDDQSISQNKRDKSKEKVNASPNQLDKKNDEPIIQLQIDRSELQNYMHKKRDKRLSGGNITLKY